MNPFEEFETEEVHILKSNGTYVGPVKCSLTPTQFTFFREDLEVETSDKILRPLPNGKAEKYDVLDVNYNAKFHDIPASWDIVVRKQGSLVPFKGGSNTNISIWNSQGFQVGDHNVQNIVVSLQQILKKINDSPASPEAKAEAKSPLKSFLEHPVTSSVFGGIAGSLF